MSITFESGGRTWKYKDKPRQIEAGEYMWNGTEELVIKWPGPRRSFAKHVPVEPVEPEEVTVTLRTDDLKKALALLQNTEWMGSTAQRVAEVLKREGVSV